MKRSAFARMFTAATVLAIGASLVASTMDRPLGTVAGLAGPIASRSLGGDPSATSLPTPGGRARLGLRAHRESGRAVTPSPSPMPTPTPDPMPTPTPATHPKTTPSPSPTARPTPGWVTVVDDTFATAGIPRHWSLYDAPYGSGAGNCAAPSHVVVSGGVLHLLLSYEPAGAGSADCGPGWYSGGLSLKGYSSVDQRVTVRFRVVRNGVAGHFIIPMRWPDDDAQWPAAGEEDYCETSDIGMCSVYLHYDPANEQIDANYGVDLSRWHTIRTERRDHTVRIYIDDMTRPVWTYEGTAQTMPDTLKHVLLQQECQSSCPDGTDGTEDIQIDRITVADPG